MKIALISDPEIPVPPLFYGGLERIIDMLIDGYDKLGHEVSLFANPESTAKAKLFPLTGKTCTKPLDILQNSWFINKTILTEDFDVIHSFGRLIYLTPHLPVSIPKVMSYGREPTIGQIKKAMRLAKKGSLAFTGCSHYISDQIAPYAPSFAIYNGVDMSKYKFRKEINEDAPLVFLGRIEPIKGTKIAIEVAKKSGKKLIIAGNIPEEHKNYFETEVKPFLNNSIEYVGPVNDQEKSELLSSAYAFLMPILWNEPFGMVMTEAMACGTPVIGFNRGSMPEVIKNGVNGFSCDTTEEMISLIPKILTLDREVVKNDTATRFAAEVIVEDYLNLYQKMIKKLV